MKAILIAALLLLSASAQAAGEFKAHNFTLPGGSVKVDDDRFRLPQAWEDALKFYKAVLPPAKYPRHTLHNQAGIRAIHIDNPKSTRDADDWEGANIYEIARGEVRVYILTRPGDGS